MTTERAPGPGPSLQVSVHGHPNANTVLLWHPDAASDPDPVTALASRIAGRSNLRVVVPVWHDGRDLLRSVRYARESTLHPPDSLTVVGYADAGVAALSLALHQRRLGIGMSRVTCVDAGPDIADPISGRPLGQPTGSAAETAVDVIDSADDDASAWSHRVVEDWKAAGWAATLIPADQFTWRVIPSQ